MAWKNRIRPAIKLTSPSGTEFEAYWRGDSRERPKKLGIFDLPRIRGAKIQDLDVSSTRYRTVIFFEGADHDITADNFYAATAERGQWIVLHPTKGQLTLQLVSVREAIDPIETANITRFELEWIDLVAPSAVSSLGEVAVEVGKNIEEVNGRAEFQFEEILSTGFFQHKSGAIRYTRRYLDSFDEVFDEFTRPVSAVHDRIAAVYRSIIDTIFPPILDAATLARQVQQLLILPSLVSDSIEDRLEVYTDFLGRGLTDLLNVNKPTDYDRDSAATHELFLTATLCGIAQVAVTGLLDTRPEAVAVAEQLGDLFVEVTESLDTVQQIFAEKAYMKLEFQYFSQKDSYASTLKLLSLAAAYILRTSFDLAIERRVILRRDRSPIELVITEYGGLGERDVNLDNFIDHNSLTGREILLLPAGREVITYI